jgi:phosphoglycolate phosphatase (TIGR01487 family)
VAFFQVVAIDIDGTLTSGGRVSTRALQAIDRIRADGVKVVLVTGRIATELQAEFPELAGHVDALVVENGAVFEHDGQTHLLATPVDDVLDEAVNRRGIPYRRGQVLVALDGEYAATVAEMIAQLGLDCQLVHNRAALMVLPAGITKGSGFRAALTEMNLSPHNAVAIGDAENDLSLFAAVEIGAAVADAIPSVHRRADLVLEHPDGAGVAELLSGPYLSGARRWCPPRHWITVGTYEDGTSMRLPGSQGRILVTGPAGAGKSYLVGLLAEHWILAGYAVVVIDPEGDHTQLQQIKYVEVVGQDNLPEPVELVDRLHYPHTSVVIDLSGLDSSAKSDYVQLLRPALEAHREQHGFPHWVIYDEAQLLGHDEPARWARRGGYVLSSFTPVSLPVHEIEDSDVVLTLSATVGPTDIAGPHHATVRFAAEAERSFVITARRTTHVRHRHKYADVRLPRERRFYFHTAEAQPVPPAATMHEFGRALWHLDQQTLQYHLERGDFSRWLDNTIADKELAMRAAAWEDALQANRAADLERTRRELAKAVEERYAAPHDDR